jgi:hypothetical protein
MDSNRKGMSAPGDDTSADEVVILEPLQQEEFADGSQEQKAEGKKLTQYMAAIFGKYQGLVLVFPGHCMCMTHYYLSRVRSEEW